MACIRCGNKHVSYEPKFFKGNKVFLCYSCEGEWYRLFHSNREVQFHWDDFFEKFLQEPKTRSLKWKKREFLERVRKTYPDIRIVESFTT